MPTGAVSTCKIMNKYKVIKRPYLDGDGIYHSSGYFIARGQWADGHLAYSPCDENGNCNVNDEDYCMYVQVRDVSTLTMVRV